MIKQKKTNLRNEKYEIHSTNLSSQLQLDVIVLEGAKSQGSSMRD